MSSDHARQHRVLLISQEPVVVDSVLALAAAMGIDVEVAESPAAARAPWSQADVVVVGIDQVAGLVRVAPPRRDDVVIVGAEIGDESWRDAVSLGALDVLSLQAGEAWLAERFADLDEGPSRNGSVVAVIPGRGGAGASSLACALGLAGIRRGRRVLLVDADPRGGGIDVLAGIEQVQGLRWSDLAMSRGRIQSTSLVTALPQVHGVSVLACDRECDAIDAESLAMVIAAGSRGFDLTVVDVGRDTDMAAVLPMATRTFVVVPAEVHAISASARLLPRVLAAARAPEIILRRLPRSDIDDSLVTEALRCPIAGVIGEESALSSVADSGDAPGLRSRGALARAADAVLDHVEGS